MTVLCFTVFIYGSVVRYSRYIIYNLMLLISGRSAYVYFSCSRGEIAFIDDSVAYMLMKTAFINLVSLLLREIMFKFCVISLYMLCLSN